MVHTRYHYRFVCLFIFLNNNLILHCTEFKNNARVKGDPISRYLDNKTGTLKLIPKGFWVAVNPTVTLMAKKTFAAEIEKESNAYGSVSMFGFQSHFAKSSRTISSVQGEELVEIKLESDDCSGQIVAVDHHIIN